MKKLAIRFRRAPAISLAIFSLPDRGWAKPADPQAQPLLLVEPDFVFLPATFPLTDNHNPMSQEVEFEEDRDGVRVLRPALPPTSGEIKLKSRPPLPTRKWV